jgi:hypothetical protein
MKPIAVICLVMLVAAPASGFAQETPGAASQPAGPPKGQAIRTVPLVPPPPAKAGCYHYGPSGWVEVSCATDEYVKEHYPHPDIQQGIVSTATAATGKPLPLAYGVVDITFNAVGSISDNYFGTNAFSIQNNTNGFFGSNGDLDIVQFTVQSKPGQSDGVCIWNVDVTTQNYNNTSCTPAPNARGGGIDAGDEPVVQGYILPGHFIGITAYLPWAEGGAGVPWATVSPDTYDLADNWIQVSGGVLGFGTPLGVKLGDALTFSYADLWTQIGASICAADTVPSFPIPSSCPAQPLFYPYATVLPPLSAQTIETNNLVTPPSIPPITWANNDLALLGYPEMVPIPGCQLSSVTTCVAQTGAYDNISAVVSTVDPNTCPTLPPLSMQILYPGNGFATGVWTSLPQPCSNGSLPGGCSPSDNVPNEFVLGTQMYGITQSGASAGSTQTVRVCDGVSLCSPFTLPVPICPSLPSARDHFFDGNCSPVTAGMDQFATCFLQMNGPWVAADSGTNAKAWISGGNLPLSVCTAQISAGEPNYGDGVRLPNGYLILTVTCPLSAIPGTYTATVSATDSGVTHSTTVTIQVLPCVPSNSCIQGFGGTCGSVPNGCGGTVDCGNCGPGLSCMNSICCPPGYINNSVYGCTRPCPAGTSFCGATTSCVQNGLCLGVNCYRGPGGTVRCITPPGGPI